MMRVPIVIIADRRGSGKVWGWARFGKEVQDRRLPAVLPTSHFLPKTCQIPNLPFAARMSYVLRSALAAQVPVRARPPTGPVSYSLPVRVQLEAGPQGVTVQRIDGNSGELVATIEAGAAGSGAT